MSSAEPRPYAEMLAIALELEKRLAPVAERIEIAGSLRRRRPQVRDLEIVAIPRFETIERKVEIPGDIFQPARVEVRTERVNAVWERLDELADSGSFTKRGERYRKCVFAGAPLDLFLADRDNWGNILLIRTGSADFSHWIMSELNTRGFTSHEGRIKRHDGTRAREPYGAPIPTPAEADVFRLAGHVFIEPLQREISPGVRRAR